jgi:hypothetical protein
METYLRYIVERDKCLEKILNYGVKTKEECSNPWTEPKSTPLEDMQAFFQMCKDGPRLRVLHRKAEKAALKIIEPKLNFVKAVYSGPMTIETTIIKHEQLALVYREAHSIRNRIYKKLLKQWEKGIIK